MWVIGIVGGVASGKTRVAEQFARLGAHIIQADLLGHAVLREREVIAQLHVRWGDRVLNAGGEIDRAAVARIVFAPSEGGREELRFLESVTHPRIAQRMSEEIAEQRALGTVPAVVLDAAILLEAGWGRLCDRIVYVDVARAERLARARQRGWSEAEFAAREASQLSLKEKRKVADGVIDNAGSIDHTFAQVQQFWQSLNLSRP